MRFQVSEIKPALLDLKSLMLQYAFEQGVNFEKRTILICGEIDSDTFQKVDAALTEMESDSGKSITIKINSAGGDVYNALAIIGRMKASKCKVNTEGYGHIMSAAVAILAAGKKRKMSSVAWGMVHQASYEMAGSVAKHKEVLEQSEREENQWAEIMSLCSTETKDFWIEACSRKDKYMKCEEMFELGVIDEII